MDLPNSPRSPFRDVPLRLALIAGLCLGAVTACIPGADAFAPPDCGPGDSLIPPPTDTTVADTTRPDPGPDPQPDVNPCDPPDF